MVQQAGQCYQSTIQYSNCNTKINHTVLTVVKLASLIYAQFQSSAKLSKVTTDVTMIDFDIMSLSYIYILFDDCIMIHMFHESYTMINDMIQLLYNDI